MIVEWFFSLMEGVADWFLGLFGTADPPAFMTTVVTTITGFISGAAGLGAWIPWSFIGVVTTTVLGLWLAGLLVKALRWLWGLGPWAGGS